MAAPMIIDSTQAKKGRGGFAFFLAKQNNMWREDTSGAFHALRWAVNGFTGDPSRKTKMLEYIASLRQYAFKNADPAQPTNYNNDVAIRVAFKLLKEGWKWDIIHWLCESPTIVGSYQSVAAEYLQEYKKHLHEKAAKRAAKSAATGAVKKVKVAPVQQAASAASASAAAAAAVSSAATLLAAAQTPDQVAVAVGSAAAAAAAAQSAASAAGAAAAAAADATTDKEWKGRGHVVANLDLFWDGLHAVADVLIKSQTRAKFGAQLMNLIKGQFWTDFATRRWSMTALTPDMYDDIACTLYAVPLGKNHKRHAYEANVLSNSQSHTKTSYRDEVMGYFARYTAGVAQTSAAASAAEQRVENAGTFTVGQFTSAISQSVQSSPAAASAAAAGSGLASSWASRVPKEDLMLFEMAYRNIIRGTVSTWDAHNDLRDNIENKHVDLHDSRADVVAIGKAEILAARANQFAAKSFASTPAADFVRLARFSTMVEENPEANLFTRIGYYTMVHLMNKHPQWITPAYVIAAAWKSKQLHGNTLTKDEVTEAYTRVREIAPAAANWLDKRAAFDVFTDASEVDGAAFEKKFVLYGEEGSFTPDDDLLDDFLDEDCSQASAPVYLIARRALWGDAVAMWKLAAFIGAGGTYGGYHGLMGPQVDKAEKIRKRIPDTGFPEDQFQATLFQHFPLTLRLELDCEDEDKFDGYAGMDATSDNEEEYEDDIVDYAEQRDRQFNVAGYFYLSVDEANPRYIDQYFLQGDNENWLFRLLNIDPAALTEPNRELLKTVLRMYRERALNDDRYFPLFMEQMFEGVTAGTSPAGMRAVLQAVCEAYDTQKKADNDFSGMIYKPGMKRAIPKTLQAPRRDALWG